MVEKGSRLSIRWSVDRIEKLEMLGWVSKTDAEVVDDALDAALELEDGGDG